MHKETEKLSDLSNDFAVFEGMTSIRAILEGNADGTNDRRICQILYDAARKSHMRRELGYLQAIANDRGFTVTAVDAATIAALSSGTTHGGLLAKASARTLPSLSDATIQKTGFYTLIEGIEDPYNFGYAIRSLYACGCQGIIVPGRNWFTAAGIVARSSAGASERIPVYLSDDAMEAVDIFHRHAYTVVCAEEKTEQILGRCPMPLPLLLIVGGEKRGISAAVVQAADLRVKIAYARPFRASLSAASATTMFAYEIARQNADFL